MSKIEKTSDYSLFKKHENNRNLSETNIRNLTFSIKAQNLLSFRPIMVNERMEILDGQHRLEAAKRLGVEIYYQVKKESNHEDIVLLNNNQKKWEFEDYLNYYCSLGNNDYLQLRDFIGKRNITLKEIKNILSKTSGGWMYWQFKRGAFKFFSKEEVDSVDLMIVKVKYILDDIKRYLPSNPAFIDSFRMRTALMSIIKNPQCNFDVFKSKVAYKADSLRACATSQGYYAMLRDIYNWKNSNPIE